MTIDCRFGGALLEMGVEVTKDEEAILGISLGPFMRVMKASKFAEKCGGDEF